MQKTHKNFKTTKYACFTAYFTMSSVFSLPPVLFLIFRQLYDISYTLLGTLVLVNFCTQLIIDLIFSVFSKHFNIKKTVRIMPLVTTAGLVIYAAVPAVFPDFAYIGLIIGTVVFSVAAGLSEVLLSPTIAAIPSDNPQRDMSALHSLYAFGVFTVVVISTLFLKIFGNENWIYLTMFWAVLPIIAAVMFMISPMPELGAHPDVSKTAAGKEKITGIALCLGCIFFGSCAENGMSNWISGYMEAALNIDKALGDILGMAMFAILLGIARIAYSRYGKHILRVLFIGMAGASVCYLTAGLTRSAAAALAACVLTGLFTSMLWPGTLIMMEEKMPGLGVTAYALMAAGGDLGASVSPQLMGIVTDKVSASGFAESLSFKLGLTCEQIGLKAGMLVSAVFPILGTVLVLFTIRYFKKQKKRIS